MSGLLQFDVVCRKCQALKKRSNVHVHVDWKKMQYMFVCLDKDCGSAEVFNEFGERVFPREDKTNNN